MKYHLRCSWEEIDESMRGTSSEKKRKEKKKDGSTSTYQRKGEETQIHVLDMLQLSLKAKQLSSPV